MNDELNVLRWVVRRDKPKKSQPRHYTVGDRSRPETRRGGSGRPRRRCFVGRRRGRKCIVPVIERARTAVSECVTFSDFRGVDNDIIGGKQNSKRSSGRQEGFLCNKHGVLFSQSNAVHNPSVNQTNNSSSVLMKPHSEKTKQNQKIRYDIL